MQEKDYREALGVIHNNLIGNYPQCLKPMSSQMCFNLAKYIERILSGETPEQIKNNQ